MHITKFFPGTTLRWLQWKLTAPSLASRTAASMEPKWSFLQSPMTGCWIYLRLCFQHKPLLKISMAMLNWLPFISFHCYMLHQHQVIWAVVDKAARLRFWDECGNPLRAAAEKSIGQIEFLPGHQLPMWCICSPPMYMKRSLEISLCGSRY